LESLHRLTIWSVWSLLMIPERKGRGIILLMSASRHEVFHSSEHKQWTFYHNALFIPTSLLLA
jgi:hypothetical protein